MTDTVAIVLMRAPVRLHEHGTPLRIHSWANNTRRRLRSQGAHASANDIVVVSARYRWTKSTSACASTVIAGLYERLATLPHGKRITH